MKTMAVARPRLTWSLRRTRSTGRREDDGEEGGDDQQGHDVGQQDDARRVQDTVASTRPMVTRMVRTGTGCRSRPCHGRRSSSRTAG